MGIGFTISCTFTIDLMRIIAWSMKDEVLKSENTIIAKGHNHHLTT